MRVVDPGHLYELDTLDGDIELKLQFVKRCGEKYPGNAEPAYPGCTTQEVMRALIARTLYVNNQEPHEANAQLLSYLRRGIRILEERAAERHGMLKQFYEEVDGADRHIEELSTCDTCGHIVCKHWVQQ